MQCVSVSVQVEQVIPLPSHQEVTTYEALPSVAHPSDHIALICDLRWNPWSQTSPENWAFRLWMKSEHGIVFLQVYWRAMKDDRNYGPFTHWFIGCQLLIRSDPVLSIQSPHNDTNSYIHTHTATSQPSGSVSRSRTGWRLELNPASSHTLFKLQYDGHVVIKFILYYLQYNN